MSTSEADEDGAAAGLSGPPYPQQPTESQRPLPLRGRPERTQDPEDWRADAAEPLSGHTADATAEEVARLAHEERAAHADGRAGERRPTQDLESSYTTEQEQGAAQPGPGEERTSRTSAEASPEPEGPRSR